MASLRPPLDLSLNINEIISFHIVHENRDAAYAFADEETDQVTEISHFELARAAHRVAHILRPQRRGPEGEILGIIALTDVFLYQAIVAGCIVAGIVPFPISNRNSSAAVLHLLKSTNSHRLLATKSSLGPLLDGLVDELTMQYDLSIEEIPLQGEIYPHLGHETSAHGFMPYRRAYARPSLDDVSLYLHSSGSTGFPKSIPESHRGLILYQALHGVTQTRELSPRQNVGFLPPFHTMGILTQFSNVLLNCGTACIYPPASTATEYRVPITPTPANALDIGRKTGATGIVAVPALILEWQSDEDVAYLKTLPLLAYSGGPLAQRVGDYLVSQGCHVVSIYGGTEFGSANDVVKPPEEHDPYEWAWIRVADRVTVRWMPQGDNTYECQILTSNTHTLAVENLADAKGFSTKDLFERHPTKPNLYRIVGRLDDVIMMANGEKTVPGPMEDILIASPHINGVVVFGRERNQTGVLIEPHVPFDPADDEKLREFRNLIWPTVGEVNERTPAFSRLYKEMILVTHPAKPMVRAPKGTVIKKSTIEAYKTEIDTLYETIEATSATGCDTAPPPSWTCEEVVAWLVEHASMLANKPFLGGSCDIFEQGFDSLNATFLRLHIIGAANNDATLAEEVKERVRGIPQNFVYMHPSIAALAGAVIRLITGGEATAGHGANVAAIEAMVEKYSARLEVGLGEKAARETGSGAVVLLTGSTGGLGSQLLDQLIRSPDVVRVYAYNRPGQVTILQRQQEAFQDRALDVGVLGSQKLVFLEGDSTNENLGLTFEILHELRSSLTTIIHNAWMLDFNKCLSSFESHVKGTRNIIDLARDSEYAVRVLFTSSVASATGWDQSKGLFPEEVQLDASVAVGSGYGESKYIAERILTESGLQTTSFRIGQVSGSASNGSWTTSDWVPAIVKSSLALGAYPSAPGARANWIPPEAVCSAIVDAVFSQEPAPPAVNLVHPKPVPWDDVMSNLAGVGSERPMPLVPLGEWADQLRSRATMVCKEDLENIPGLKLLDFFDAAVSGAGNTQFATDKAEELSNSVRLLAPLSREDTIKWMTYWREKEFIVYD
ncbi:putative aminoadipate reductase [Roridomyces roridus]|uniref:Aminoadipate reductase n=1 Tax=Roridomyces roridus TaxID=1738132 RepID=A0AAD7BL41_9AGAR|nr:putative aminoadipate reductase [Roridomyces roridus]